ncbi:hypothetical protein INQ51_02835 [Maribellus sp. CM-23]|uniref:hypothetical protein n=1 Tax=Maribellus sp. CM-23 TaxID=2781026 RepID=UPI001F2802B9|nr:hypothetical protein [Maribellus sp. CM-23]MCE4563236.1 hypothetical protein [Maribellus sp. CM-23]
MKIDNKISHFLTGPYIFFGFLFIPLLLMGLLEHHPIMAGVSSLAIAYLFATYSGVEIDTETKKFRNYNKQFGLFKTGRWRSLDDYIGVTLVPIRKVYRMYSRSNRSNTSHKTEYRIYLVNQAKRPAIPIKKCKTQDEGYKCLDEFAIWLHKPVYSPK